MTNSPTEKDSRFSVQLLEKIGAPLLSVIENVAPEISDEAGQIAQAEIMAQLLGQCVAMGTMLYNTLDIKESEDKADTTRVALTSLVSPFIAEFYLKRKKIPTEENIKRMLKSLEAVLMFGENFKPASAHKSRLQTIDHKAVLFDESQPILVTMQSMVPVVNAVEEFSFGQNRRKLVKDIAARLEAKSQEIAKTQQQDKLTELIIFKGLADVYADCHRSETRRVLVDEAARDNLSVEPIWTKFEVRVKMIEALMGIGDDVPVSASAAGGGVAPAVAPAVAEAPVQAPPPVAQVQPAVEAAPPVPEAPPPVQPAAAGPMGFFKKGDEAPAAPAVEQPATPPPAPPAEAVQAVPAEAAPVATAPPVEATAPAGEVAEAPPSGPMGFFKKPKEEE